MINGIQAPERWQSKHWLALLVSAFLGGAGPALAQDKYVPMMATYTAFGDLVGAGSDAPTSRENCDAGLQRIFDALQWEGDVVGPNAIFLRDDQTLRLFMCFALQDVRDDLHIDTLPDPLSQEVAQSWVRFPEIPHELRLSRARTHRLQKRTLNNPSTPMVEWTSDPMTKKDCQAKAQFQIVEGLKSGRNERIDDTTYRHFSEGLISWVCIPTQ